MQVQMKYPKSNTSCENNSKAHAILEGAGYHNSTWPRDTKKKKNIYSHLSDEENSSPLVAD